MPLPCVLFVVVSQIQVEKLEGLGRKYE